MPTIEGTIEVPTVELRRLRALIARIPGTGSLPSYPTGDSVSLTALIDYLETAVQHCGEICINYEADRQTLRSLQADIAAMQRVLGLAR